MRALPDWFGIEEAILEYEQDLHSLDGYVALVDDAIAGFAGLKRYGAHAIEINIIAVSPQHHRRGIGAGLIAHIEANAVTAETKLLHMKTLAPTHPDPHYAKTRLFWERMGFIPMDAHDLWGEYNPCQVMVKPL